jgi:hypothetical protein
MHESCWLITEILVFFAGAGLSLLWTRVYRDKGQGASPNSSPLLSSPQKVFLRFLTLFPHPPDSTNEKTDVTAQLLGLHLTGSRTLGVHISDVSQPGRSLHVPCAVQHLAYARKKKIPIARSRSGNRHVVKPEPFRCRDRPSYASSCSAGKKLDMSSLSVGFQPDSLQSTTRHSEAALRRPPVASQFEARRGDELP